MAQITALRRAYKDAGDTTDCQCIRIELKDGTVLRYTDSLEDLTTTLSNQGGVEVPITSVTYSSLLPFNLSAVGGSTGSVSEIDLEAVMGPLGYTREQISQGLFEGARVFVFLTNYLRPVEDEEKMFTGFWGETTTIDGRFVTKFKSLLSVFEVDTTRVISQFCDAKFTGPRCGVKMVPTLRDGTGNVDTFTPADLEPTSWYDFSDSSTLTISSGRISVVQDKGSLGVLLQGSGSTTSYPVLSTLNGIQSADFSYNVGTSLTRKSLTNNTGWPTAAGIIRNTTNDVYIVCHSYDGETRVGFIGTRNFSSTLPYGPLARDSDTSANTVVNPNGKTYDSDLLLIPTRDDLHTYIQSPAILMSNSATGATQFDFIGYSELGAFTPDSGCNIGEIIIIPQTNDIDRLKVINYLGQKWGISTSGITTDVLTASTTDAKLRRVAYDPAIDYLWFEAITTGAIGGVNPFTASPIGTEITDNEVTWIVVPARIIELTTAVSQGLNNQIQVNQTLPSDFADVYANGKLEFLTGPNAGTDYVIIGNTLNTFTINTPVITATELNDQIRITIACNKTTNECRNKFMNGTNFQGFPDLPTKANIFKFGEK